jgi:hypothetical protein
MIDDSRSVSENRFYFRMLWELVNSYRAKFPRATFTFYTWGSAARLCTNVDAFIAAESGPGNSTLSSLIAFTANNLHFTDYLVIITDGQVQPEEVTRCATILGARTFRHVDCHMVYTGGPVNESVPSPFQWGSPVAVTRWDPQSTANYMPVTTSLHASEFTMTVVTPPTLEHLRVHDTVATIHTPEEFLAQFEELKRLITTRTLGRSTRDAALHAALVALQSRFSHAARSAASSGGVGLDLHDAVLSRDVGRIIAVMQQIHDPSASAPSWAALLAQLISFADGGLKNTMSSAAARALKAEPVAPAPPSAGLPAAEDADTSAGSAAAMCPITLDQLTTGNTFVPVTPGPPLLSLLVDPNAVLNSPLNAILFLDFLSAFIKRFDKPVSREGYLMAGPAGLQLSPETRAVLMTNGVLDLAPTAAAVRTTDWTLARMLNNGKRAGRATSWVALLWYLVKTGQIPPLADIEPALRVHLLFRLHDRTRDFTTVSLSGSIDHQLLKAPTACAIVWVLFAGAFIRVSTRNPDKTGPLPAKADPIRLHMAAIPILLQLLELLDIPLPPECAAHILRTRVLFDMLRVVKVDADAPGQVAYNQFRRRIRALFQHSVCMPDGDYVLLDGPCTAPDAIKADFPPLWRDLSREWICTLGSLVDPSKSEGDIETPHTVSESPPVLASWTTAPARLSSRDQLHPFTARLQTRGRNMLGPVVAMVYPEPGRYFSTDELLAAFVTDTRRLPADHFELLTFMSEKMRTAGDRPTETLPAAAVQYATSALADYTPFITELGQEKFRQMRGADATAADNAAVLALGIVRFVARRNASVNRLDGTRGKIESGVLPHADP